MSYDETRPWPDAERVAVALLSPIATTVTVTPEQLTLPIIQVLRVGGSDDGVTDFPRIEVTVIASRRDQAWQLAEHCRQRILAAVAHTIGEALIDNTRTETPAQQVPDINVDLRRVVATYRLAMRRCRAT